MVVGQLPGTIRGELRQAWRDLLSVYYANTPTWRWLKSGTLVFFGFFLWMGGAVLLSVQPQWGFLTYAMAYGMLLLIWGPFTHLVVVPVTIRLRRTAEHPIARTFSRNSGKINLTIFFACVIALGTIAPGFMVLEFSPGDGGNGINVEGDLQCDVSDDPITCQIEDPEGFDYITVQTSGQTIATADTPPYADEFSPDELQESRTGKEFRVQLRDSDGDILREFVRVI
jgi:hypothetical protein